MSFTAHEGLWLDHPQTCSPLEWWVQESRALLGLLLTTLLMAKVFNRSSGALSALLYLALIILWREQILPL